MTDPASPSDAEIDAAVTRLGSISTGSLTTQLLKRGLPSTFMAGVWPLSAAAGHFAARAYTLRLIPMREDKRDLKAVTGPDYPQRRALEECPPGHALVIDARGISTIGTLGDIVVARLQARGVAAVVTDGAMRDSGPMVALGFPVFCAGACAQNSHVIHYAADVQVPVACGGAAVFPGDVLVGDADGVVVFPPRLAPELADAAAEQDRLEGFLQRKIKDGAPLAGTYPPDADTLAEYRAHRDKTKGEDNDG